MGRGLPLTLILTLTLTLILTLTPTPTFNATLTRWAEGAPQPGDHLAVRYAPPRASCGVRVLTGSADGRDRCRACRLSVCVAAAEAEEAAEAAEAAEKAEKAEKGECVARDLGRLGRDGALEVRLVPPARVRRVELRCEAAQDEWLIVRELGVLPCEEAYERDEL